MPQVTKPKSARAPSVKPASCAAAGRQPPAPAGAKPPARRGPVRRATPRSVLRFWFDQHDLKDWFAGKRAFDLAVKKRFAETLERAMRGELSNWRDTPDGRLAEIIVLDQFSRQIHRGKSTAFAGDVIAVTLSQEMIRSGDDRHIPRERRFFCYMPLMHSESLEVHRQAMRVFRAFGDKNMLQYEKAHRDVIARFGRYPMRNAALGRKSSRAEIAYMQDRRDSMF
jgi:uncharacterized protein (DUF924 family)